MNQYLGDCVAVGLVPVRKLWAWPPFSEPELVSVALLTRVVTSWACSGGIASDAAYMSAMSAKAVARSVSFLPQGISV